MEHEERAPRRRVTGTHYVCGGNFSVGLVLVQLDCGCLVKTDDDEEGNIVYRPCECRKEPKP